MEKKYKVFYQGSLYGHFGRDAREKKLQSTKASLGAVKNGLCRLYIFAARDLLQICSRK